MNVLVDEELRTIAQRIVQAKRPLDEWRAIESDDMFRTTHYSGGFDATEDAFCFSFYPETGAEQWFQFSVDDAVEIAEGRVGALAARVAD